MIRAQGKQLHMKLLHGFPNVELKYIKGFGGIDYKQLVEIITKIFKWSTNNGKNK